MKIICSTNHEVFLSSVEQLVNINHDVTTLKENVQSFDQSLQTSGKELLEKRKQLTKLLRTYNNVLTARSQLVNCLNLLSRAKRIQQTMEKVCYFTSTRDILHLTREIKATNKLTNKLTKLSESHISLTTNLRAEKSRV